MTLYGSTPESQSHIPTPPAAPQQYPASSDASGVVDNQDAVPPDADGRVEYAETPNPYAEKPSPYADSPVEFASLPEEPSAAATASGDLAGADSAASGASAAGARTSATQTTPTAVARVSVTDAFSLTNLPDLGDDEPPIPPWDRRPLMVVIAGAAVLVLLAIASGIASANLFGGPPPTWRQPAADESPEPGGAPAVPPAEEQTVTLSGVGDVILGNAPGSVPPNGGTGFFDDVKSALVADLVMGNLDMPLTEHTGRVKCGEDSTACHQFYLPPQYAEPLREAGFHLMSLANNHTRDMGPEGLRNTQTALEAVGIEHTGAPGQITVLDVKGVKVAVLGFSVYSWTQNLNNIEAAEDLVREADDQADIVVIQMQGGAEGADKRHVRPGTETFFGENRGDLMAFSRAVIDAGADVIFGHGPHIMRGMEFYKGRLIAYSLGNFCGYKVLNSNGFLGVGGVLKVTLRKDGTWVSGELVPTEMVRGGYPAPDPDKRALAFVNDLSQEDFGDNAARISETDGTITPPTTP